METSKASQSAAGPVIAAIDIGTNSIKMTVARPDGAGGLDELARATETVRLGAGVEASGRLAADRIEAAHDTLRRFAAEARVLGAERLIAVATDATRVATNGPAFIDQLRRDPGIDVRAISGDEEAALTFQGLAVSTDVSGELLVADIGGGSTEFIHAVDSHIQFARSLPLGSGRLTERHVRADPPAADELDACQTAALDIVEGAADLALPVAGELRLVVVGGTGEYLARLVPDAGRITRGAITEVLNRLQTLPATRLADTLAIAEARARVLPAGIAIVAAIAALTTPRRVEVARSGIRAGLLLAAFEELAVPSGRRVRSGESR